MKHVTHCDGRLAGGSTKTNRTSLVTVSLTLMWAHTCCQCVLVYFFSTHSVPVLPLSGAMGSRYREFNTINATFCGTSSSPRGPNSWKRQLHLWTAQRHQHTHTLATPAQVIEYATTAPRVGAPTPGTTWQNTQVHSMMVRLLEAAGQLVAHDAMCGLLKDLMNKMAFDPRPFVRLSQSRFLPIESPTSPHNSFCKLYTFHVNVPSPSLRKVANSLM